LVFLAFLSMCILFILSTYVPTIERWTTINLVGLHEGWV
jgi:hypothetical protein